MTPRIIVIEGTEATGTTTHVRDLAAALRAQGYAVYPFHHERPTDATAHARALDYATQRSVIADMAAGDWRYIILADRWWHTAHVEALLATDDRPGLLALAQAEALLLPVPLLVAVLTAEDATLDARMILRGETPTDADRARRVLYRECSAPGGVWHSDEHQRTRDGTPPPLHVVSTDRPRADVAADLLALALALALRVLA